MPDHYSGPEYRTVTDIREHDGDGDGRTLEVTFARFSEWNEIWSPEGRFLERIEPGAFASTFAEHGDNIRCLFNHGHDPSVGDKPLGRVRSLTETDTGPHAVVDLLDRGYVDDIAAGVRAGLYGASYRFGVVAEEWSERPERSEWNPDRLPERTLQKLVVAEFGPVTFPADAGTNQMIGVRSLTDRFNKDRVAGMSEHPSGADTATNKRALTVTAFTLNRRQQTTPFQKECS